MCEPYSVYPLISKIMWMLKKFLQWTTFKICVMKLFCFNHLKIRNLTNKIKLKPTSDIFLLINVIEIAIIIG